MKLKVVLSLFVIFSFTLSVELTFGRYFDFQKLNFPSDFFQYMEVQHNEDSNECFNNKSAVVFSDSENFISITQSNKTCSKNPSICMNNTYSCGRLSTEYKYRPGYVGVSFRFRSVPLPGQSVYLDFVNVGRNSVRLHLYHSRTNKGAAMNYEINRCEHNSDWYACYHEFENRYIETEKTIPLKSMNIYDGEYHSCGFFFNDKCAGFFVDEKLLAQECGFGITPYLHHEDYQFRFAFGFVRRNDASSIEPWEHKDVTVDFRRVMFYEGVYRYPDGLSLYYMLFITAPVTIVLVLVGIFMIGCVCICSITFKKNSNMMTKNKGGGDMNKRIEELNRTSSKLSFDIDKNLFSIDQKDVKLIEILGNGGSDCVVYLATWKGTKCVAKMYTPLIHEGNPDYDDFKKEATVTKSLSHPNLINMFGAVLVHPRVGLILEWCELGDLIGYVGNKKSKKEVITIKTKLKILFGVVVGMEYMHDRSVLHRDLKSANILLTLKSGEIISKIIDFGISKIQTGKTLQKTKRIGTSQYMSPEITKGNNYDEMCDVYSFAIVAFELLEENFTPYGSEIDFNIEFKCASNPNFRPKWSNKTKHPDWLVELVELCWNDNSKKRKSFSEIKKFFEEELN